MSDQTERYYAEMEAARNEAEKAYFEARPSLGAEVDRALFRAGFERAYAKLWPLAIVQIDGRQRAAQETCAHQHPDRKPDAGLDEYTMFRRAAAADVQALQGHIAALYELIVDMGWSVPDEKYHIIAGAAAAMDAGFPIPRPAVTKQPEQPPDAVQPLTPLDQYRCQPEKQTYCPHMDMVHGLLAEWLAAWDAGADQSGLYTRTRTALTKIACSCGQPHCSECGEDPAIVGYACTAEGKTGSTQTGEAK